MSLKVGDDSKDGNEAPAFYTKDITEMFDKAKNYINLKREKEEQVLRFSKDITWEAKRVIFNLHQFMKSDVAVQQARIRLNFILKSERHFLGLALALEDQDKSMHYRRYNHCLQEFIEAFIFLTYLEKKCLPSYEEIRDLFIYELPCTPNAEQLHESEDTSEAAKVASKRVIRVPCPINDYILGAADFTGELMKATVPTLTKPQWHTFLFQSFAMVREIYFQLQGVLCDTRDFKSKLGQMRLNVLKIENNVYKVKIKILTYGHLPEKEWLEERTSNELSHPGRLSKISGKNKNDEGDYGDSGVE